MSILNRFAEIMKANVNAMFDKWEDPAKMVDQTLLNLREDLAQVKKDTASVMADQKRAQREYDECNTEVEKREVAARNALASGNEDDARKILTKKAQLEEKRSVLKGNLDLANNNADKMRQMHDKMVSDIESLELKKDTIKATTSAAKAQQRINKMAGSTEVGKSVASFERMEEKANKMLDSALAEAELNSSTESEDDVTERYLGQSDANVDAELERLKKEMGIN